MESESRVAVIAMMIEKEEAAEKINGLLHAYANYIIGRMGIPYREKGISVITVVLDAPADAVSALSGKLGRIPGIISKVVYSKKQTVREESGSERKD